MHGSLYLAWQYVCRHRATTAILVAAVTLIAYLPAALNVIVDNAQHHFRARADATPVIVGPRGSRLELVLAALYFDRPYDEVVRMEQVRQIEAQRLGLVIPLHTRFQTRDCTIVGTTASYSSRRQLAVTQGRMWQTLGECVVGACAAERLDVRVGSKIPVSSKSAFLLDNPPLRLHVVGVFAVTETPDDEALFVDLKTTWIIEGLGHGHASGAPHGSTDAALYTDITEENAGRVHFHGDRSTFPINAMIVVPKSTKAETLLLGQYFSSDEAAQIARPREVMDALLAKIVMVRSYMIAIVAIVSFVTLLTMALVVALSIRLRRSEMITMSKIGCSRFAIASILGSQILIILLISTAIATSLTLVTAAFGRELVRLLIL